MRLTWKTLVINSRSCFLFRSIVKWWNGHSQILMFYIDLKIHGFKICFIFEDSSFSLVSKFLYKKFSNLWSFWRYQDRLWRRQYNFMRKKVWKFQLIYIYIVHSLWLSKLNNCIVKREKLIQFLLISIFYKMLTWIQRLPFSVLGSFYNACMGRTWDYDEGFEGHIIICFNHHALYRHES